MDWHMGSTPINLWKQSRVTLRARINPWLTFLKPSGPTSLPSSSWFWITWSSTGFKVWFSTRSIFTWLANSLKWCGKLFWLNLSTSPLCCCWLTLTLEWLIKFSPRCKWPSRPKRIAIISLMSIFIWWSARKSSLHSLLRLLRTFCLLSGLTANNGELVTLTDRRPIKCSHTTQEEI